MFQHTNKNTTLISRQFYHTIIKCFIKIVCGKGVHCPKSPIRNSQRLKNLFQFLGPYNLAIWLNRPAWAKNGHLMILHTKINLLFIIDLYCIIFFCYNFTSSLNKSQLVGTLQTMLDSLPNTRKTNKT